MKTFLLKRTVITTVLCLMFVLLNVGLYAQQYPIVTSPNGGENWQVGSVHDILWQKGPPPVLAEANIEYSTDNGTTWINVTPFLTMNTGSYSWTIPNTPSTQCLVKVENDVSDNVFTISSVTGINETKKNDISFIYPNPNNGYFSINVTGITDAVELSIINLQGQVVYKEKLNITSDYTKQFDISAFPKGIYFIKLINKDVVSIEKVVIK